ncbi:MAG TPA: M23 family metallopeptidase, partial [Devosia sp.]|nr:M23 family metallopeptidase [Devosia sp.]
PAAAPAQTTPIQTNVPLPADAGGEDYAEAGWGETLSGAEAALPDFAPDLVENTTTVLPVADESQRFVPSQDVVLRILVPRDLKSLLPETPFAEAALTQFDEAMKTLLGKAALEPGDVVGLRGWRHSSTDPVIELMQVSIKAGDAYLGTLSRSDAGPIVLGADPWINSDFLAPQDSQQILQPGRQYRLLDAIYSTAVRNGVPTAVLGETIKLMSRAFDLNAFASTEDRLVLAYAEQGTTEGRVLYAAIRGTGRNFECYVFRNDPSQEFSCFTENSRGQVAAMPSGMVTPVPGVLTSTFGPRMHPIFHETRVHTGVDWAAPTGTPVLAAFAGEIASAGDGGGYGNLLRISHPGGRETRYAHLKAFAAGMVPGRKVAAGEVVGFVGTTGNSTGPHLHFELRVAGAPVNPLAAEVDRAEAFVSDGSAVDELTERIVAVESGGNASARNPLSTATGAGQFISATWVRMMQTYRPDLASALDQAALLALRNDPTISREMVRNLAREGEAYLKARGHGVTAGRLYLCHFLGMEDAHRVLSADGALPLAQVLSPGVIAANPFLTGKDVNYVIAWAEAKMSGRVPRPAG